MNPINATTGVSASSMLGARISSDSGTRPLVSWSDIARSDSRSARPGSGGQGRDENGLDRVHPVFGLFEDDRRGRLEDLLGHFHAVDPELLVDLLAHLRLAVVEGGQAMHELHVRVAGASHHIRVDLIG